MSWDSSDDEDECGSEFSFDRPNPGERACSTCDDTVCDSCFDRNRGPDSDEGSEDSENESAKSNSDKCISTIYPENEGGSGGSDDDDDRGEDDGTSWTFDRDVVQDAGDEDESAVSDDTLRDENTVDDEYNSHGEGTVDNDDTDDVSIRRDTRYQATVLEYQSRPSWRDSDEEDDSD